jgi:hypothetical protein
MRSDDSKSVGKGTVRDCFFRGNSQWGCRGIEASSGRAGGLDAIFANTASPDPLGRWHGPLVERRTTQRARLAVVASKAAQPLRCLSDAKTPSSSCCFRARRAWLRAGGTLLLRASSSSSPSCPSAPSLVPPQLLHSPPVLSSRACPHSFKRPQQSLAATPRPARQMGAYRSPRHDACIPLTAGRRETPLARRARRQRRPARLVR